MDKRGPYLGESMCLCMLKSEVFVYFLLHNKAPKALCFQKEWDLVHSPEVLGYHPDTGWALVRTPLAVSYHNGWCHGETTGKGQTTVGLEAGKVGAALFFL